MVFRRLRPVLAAAVMGLLAGCAVYPDEVSDGYGGAYYGGGFYDYPGHYYSYYPGYYAYCPPVHVPRHYWSYWRKHRHWPDGWNHGHGGRDHAGHGHGDRDGRRDHDRPGRGWDNDRQGGQQAQGEDGRVGYRGMANSPQSAQGEGYRMPRLANNPAQVRGQFSRAQAAARHEWAASRAAGGDGAWRGGGSKADRAMAKADGKADRAAARSSGGGNSRSDGGSRGSSGGSRGSSGGSSGQGWSGGSSGGGGWSGGSGGGSRGGGGRGR